MTTPRTPSTPESPGAELLSIPDIERLIDSSMDLYNLVRNNPSHHSPIAGVQTRYTEEDGVVHFITGQRAAGAYPRLAISPLIDKQLNYAVGVELTYADVGGGNIETERKLEVTRIGTQRITYSRARLLRDGVGITKIRTPLPAPEVHPTIVEEGAFMQRAINELKVSSHLKRHFWDILLGRTA